MKLAERSIGTLIFWLLFFVFAWVCGLGLAWMLGGYTHFLWRAFVTGWEWAR